MGNAKQKVVGERTVWASLYKHSVFFMHVQQHNVQKGWMKVKLDQFMWWLINTLSAKHVPGLVSDNGILANWKLYRSK